MQNVPQLKSQARVFVHQKMEIAEWIGFETRNKYEILDQQQVPLAYAAEQGRGFIQQIFRQFLGHWRTFEILFFTLDRQVFLKATHPFRWYFQRLELSEPTGRYLGVVEKRFAILHKSFAVLDAGGQVLLEVSSPIWKLWTFPFKKQDREVAVIRKKWAGLLTEALTDKDKFLVEFNDPNLREDERHLILAAAIFIDMQYFEKKAGN